MTGGHTPFGAQAEPLDERTVRPYDVRHAAADVVVIEEVLVGKVIFRSRIKVIIKTLAGDDLPIRVKYVLRHQLIEHVCRVEHRAAGIEVLGGIIPVVLVVVRLILLHALFARVVEVRRRFTLIRDLAGGFVANRRGDRRACHLVAQVVTVCRRLTFL